MSALHGVHFLSIEEVKDNSAELLTILPKNELQHCNRGVYVEGGYYCPRTMFSFKKTLWRQSGYIIATSRINSNRFIHLAKLCDS